MAYETSLQRRINELVKKHGGLRKAARAVQVKPSYLWRLQVGEKSNPSGDILKKLGLKKQIVYWAIEE